MNPTSIERTALPFARYAALSLVAIALTSLVLAGASGCGGSKSEPSSSNDPTPAPATSVPQSSTPVPDTLASPAATDPAAATAQLFKNRCALCHGPDGHGDGPGSKALNPKPRNFHDQAYMGSRTDAQLSA